MKKLLSNLIGSYAASFFAMYGSGLPLKQAAIGALIATLSNAAGLYQEKPKGKIADLTNRFKK